MRPAGWLLGFLVLLLCAATRVDAQATPATAQDAAPQRFRVAVDVIAVDAQVIDRQGRPVPNLGAEKFTVTINGHRRRVVSAEQIGRDADQSVTPGSTGSTAVGGRIIVIAVDCISFDVTASREVIQSVAEFVRGLNDDDYVGLNAYPNGARISPTTDHGSVLRALDTVIGQREGPGLTQFHLRPTEIIDMTQQLSAGGGPTVDAVIARECGGVEEPGAFCRYQLLAEVTNTALYYEGQATASLGMLRTLVRQMQGINGRKTLILVSGGMVASDRPGGRPDLGGLGVQVGKEAAAANTAIYTLFIDSSLHDRFRAETRTADRTVDNQGRDTALLGRWLEQFSGAAGGALYTVRVGNAASTLARIKNELTSYYLLGVEPADEDRDGRTHEISVKTTEPNVTIRGRRWVMVPKRGAAAAPAAPTPATVAPPTTLTVPPAPRTVPQDVQALADVYDRGNDDTFRRAILQTPELANTIRGFRVSDSPWPEDRKRTAVFALELALAGLRSGNTFARDEGGRLLAEYHVRIRQPGDPDEFECWWFLTEAAALEGLFMPENALLFVPRALQRCPASARLHLAYAFVSEQQWLRGNTTQAQEQDIVARYEGAMKFPETAAEARVRAARFLYTLGAYDRALQAIDAAAAPPADPEIKYYTELVRGQILRALKRPDDAAAAFRAALTTSPGAQSARVALMTLLVSRGEREEAASLAEAALTAPADQYDPWWTYWLGDYRAYPAIADRLKELAR